MFAQTWKFFALKKYHWFLSMLELTLPSCFCLFLLLKKAQIQPIVMESCHYREQFLPSSGISLWWQSLMCYSADAISSTPGLSDAFCHKERKFKPICPVVNDKFSGCLVDWIGNATKYNKSSVEAMQDMCGIDKDDLKGGKKQGRKPPGQEKQGDKIKKKKYVDDPGLSKECNVLMRYLYNKQSFLWMIMHKEKPLMFGKILYTPDDERAHAIIRHANETTFKTIIENLAIYELGLKKKNETEHDNDPIYIMFKCMLLVLDKFEAVSESAVMEKAKKLDKNKLLLAVVKFHFEDDSKQVPTFLNYTIRMSSNIANPQSEVMHINYSPLQRNTRTLNFASIQDIVENAFIGIHKANFYLENNISVTLQQMPQVCTQDDKFLGMLSKMLPFAMVVQFLLPYGILVSDIVQEKQDRLKELMLIMSMERCTYWASWYLCSVLWWTWIAMNMHIFLIFVVLDYVEVTFILSLTFLYILACVSQAFLLSSFFNSSGTALGVASLFYLLLFYSQNLFQDGDLDHWIKLAAVSLVPQIGFSQAIAVALAIRRRGEKTTWYDISLDTSGGTSLLVVMITLFVVAVIYMLMTLYVETVSPGKYGIGKEWCICPPKIGKSANKSYNFTKPKKKHKKIKSIRNIGVKLCGVAKQFKTQAESIEALSDISLEFYRNEIAIILGQNGAGKSTLFSLMVGTTAATKGDIFIKGKSIKEYPAEVRKTIGFCPQNNTLFGELTVREHVWLFWMLKTGVFPNSREVKDIISKATFEDNVDVIASNLSGGNKRKLSICLAFCGTAEVVLLDEPTSGVDPLSRKAIWKLLAEHKNGRTIVMSTHLMEEADEMGDRIAIIHFGKLMALDTAMNLKQRFAHFYMLIIVTSDNAVVESVTQLINGLFAEPVHVKKGLKETKYTIPQRNLDDAEKIIYLIRYLEEENKLKYGIKASGMEDVFLAAIGSIKCKKVSRMFYLKPPTRIPEGVIKRQAYALLVKQFTIAKRGWKGLFTQTFVPILYIIFTISTQKRKYQVIQEFPIQVISSNLYSPHTRDMHIPYLNHYIQSDFMKEFEKEFLSKSGFGSHCTHKGVSPSIKKMCQPQPSKKTLYKFNNLLSKWNTGCNCCKCINGKQKCDYSKVKKYVRSFSKIKLSSGELLLNVRKQNMTHYLLYTDKYMYKKRYNGLEFLSANLLVNKSSKYKDDIAVNKSIRIWFDGRASYSGPAYLNAVNNVILRTLQNHSSDFGISIQSHPIAGSLTAGKTIYSEFHQSFLAGISILIAASVVSTSWVMHYLEENISKLKLVLYLEGLSPLTYWSFSLAFESIIYVLFSVILLCVLIIFNLSPYAGKGQEGNVLLLLLLFGFANIPLSASITFVAQNGSQVFMLLVGLIVFNLGLCFLIITSKVLQESSDSALSYIFMLIPHYCFIMGLWDIAYIETTNAKLAEYGSELKESPSDWSMLGKYYFVLIIFGCAAFAFLVLFDSNRIKCELYKPSIASNKIKCKPCLDSDINDHLLDFSEDEEVAKERQRIYNGKHVDDMLVMKDLTKAYQPYPCLQPAGVAVRGLTVGIKQGSCFGLLGLNGAGKTTVLKMLTNETNPSGGCFIFKDQDKGVPTVGYCPQNDTHNLLLTPTEILTFHCRLRLYEEDNIPDIVHAVLKQLDLLRYKDVICRSLSGGTNRRLSVGVAFIGCPQMIILDEATTGLDPVSRRLVWDLVSYSKNTFILVSHIVEECEALCDVISIMSNGKFVSMGSPQHLKNKLGNEYVIKISKLLDETLDVLGWIKFHFPSAYRIEETPFSFKFRVDLSQVWLSYIFIVLSQLQFEGNPLSYYTVSQVTLNDVFLQISESQTIK